VDKQGTFTHSDGKYTRFLLQRSPYGGWHLWVSEPGERAFTRDGHRHWLVNILRELRADIHNGGGN
jgi:hypothetical protein